MTSPSPTSSLSAPPSPSSPRSSSPSPDYPSPALVMAASAIQLAPKPLFFSTFPRLGSPPSTARSAPASPSIPFFPPAPPPPLPDVAMAFGALMTMAIHAARYLPFLPLTPARILCPRSLWIRSMGPDSGRASGTRSPIMRSPSRPRLRGSQAAPGILMMMAQDWGKMMKLERRIHYLEY